MNSKEETSHEDYEKIILTSLYEGEMTFSQAATKLDVSKEKIKEMFESFNWIPSSAYMHEIYEIEKEVMAHIEESKPIIHKLISVPYSYRSMTFDKQIVDQKLNSWISITNTPYIEESIVADTILNDNSISYY